jgi:aspartate aminotransferase
MPEGAFYAFPNVADLFGRKSGDVVIKNSMDFCSFVLDEARVAMVPGKAFGCDNFVRLSYAVNMQSIKNGIERIRNAMDKLE